MVHGAFGWRAWLWPQHRAGACGLAWRTTKRLGVLLKAGSLKLELKLALNLLCSVHAFVKHIRRKQDQEKRKYPFEFFNG